MKTNKKPLITVCITTYNRFTDTLACLDSVYKSKFHNFETIVFDNHSDKKFNKSILSPYHNIRYIYNDKNIGVAGAKAVFEVKAKGKYIMMLDSDTLIDKNMLGELVKEIEQDSKIGICAPKMYFYDKRKTNILIGGLGKFSKITTLCSDKACFQKDRGQFNDITPIDYAQHGYMIRKTVMDFAGGHDCRLVMTYSETDFFIRVQEKGFKTIYVPQAKLWHRTKLIPSPENILRDELGLSDAKRIYYNMRNRSIVVKRYSPYWAKIIYLSSLVHLFLVFYLYKFTLYKAQKDYFVHLVRGYVEGLEIFIGLRKL